MCKEKRENPKISAEIRTHCKKPILEGGMAKTGDHHHGKWNRVVTGVSGSVHPHAHLPYVRGRHGQKGHKGQHTKEAYPLCDGYIAAPVLAFGCGRRTHISDIQTRTLARRTRAISRSEQWMIFY